MTVASNSDIPLEKLMEIARKFDIADEFVVPIKKRLDETLDTGSFFRCLRPIGLPLTPKKISENLAAASKAAEKLLEQIEDENTFAVLLHHYRQAIETPTLLGPDSKRLATSSLRQDYEGLKRIAVHAAEAASIEEKIESGELAQITILRERDETSSYPFPIMIHPENPALPFGKNANPDVCILVCAIYEIWELMLGRVADAEQGSEFFDFADKIFELVGDKNNLATLESRLKNKKYEAYRERWRALLAIDRNQK